jgi:hypothetical protein
MKRFLSRRQALREAATGFGGMALSSIIAMENRALANSLPTYNLAPKKPHFAPKAKNVIFIYIGGGRRPSTCSIPSPRCASTTANRRRLRSRAVR